MDSHENHDLAMFGGGCFWCTQAVFDPVRGVTRVTCGYSGGASANPTYEQVCSGTTGHAEVVQVEFNSDEVSYRDLLEIFFATHDPTTLNRQGNDVGTQYRSVVFWHDDSQLAIARELIETLDHARVFAAPIVTQVERAGVFYPAEDYHQDYFATHPDQAYCAAVIRPKLEKFVHRFRDRLKP
jgi:peptide-methionine (S)-S-oxide reductase